MLSRSILKYMISIKANNNQLRLNRVNIGETQEE